MALRLTSRAQKDPLSRAFCRVVQARHTLAGAARRGAAERRNPRTPAAQGGLAWDSLHFLRIAQCGYETEKSHAFFPLLPGAMRALQATGARCLACMRLHHRLIRPTPPRAVLRSLLPALYPRCTLALAGFLLSNVCFVFAALSLYWRARMRMCVLHSA